MIPTKRKRAPSTAQRILLWLQALPGRTPDERGYVAEMEELSGLPQAECSHAAKGKIRAWTTRRLDQVAQHRGQSVPQLMLEIYEVSDKRIGPKRTFEIPAAAIQDYLREVERLSYANPTQMKRATLQLRYMHRMGLGAVVTDIVHEILTRGPGRAVGKIAEICGAFLDHESPGDARKRERMAKLYLEDLAKPPVAGESP